MTYGTLEQCRKRVLGSTAGLTPEQIDEVTARAFGMQCQSCAGV